MRNYLSLNHLGIMSAAMLLTACIGEPVVPVSDLTTPRDRYAARVVRPGDTLYMIAWDAGLDHRQLAEWNGLVPPYRIKPGMRIRLASST